MRDGTKPLSRVLNDALLRCATAMPHRVVQRFIGTAVKVYKDWAKDEAYVEDVGADSAKLLWIGKKKTERVVLYVHGGAFIIPTIAGALPFWSYVKGEVAKRLGHDELGIAVFSYTLLPAGVFPTPLKQLIDAISHLEATGTSPSQLYLVGDSAGGNLILQLLAHRLRPIPSIPRSLATQRFGGIYLMSPWVDLLGMSFAPDMPYAAGDILTPSTLKSWGSIQRMYVQMLDLPQDFFKGLDAGQRILVSYGGREVLREAIKVFCERHFEGRENVRVVCDVNGVHDDPLQDFNMFGASPGGELTVAIVDWLVESMS
ncbi:alpha/beta-hydrolase [Hymenopellis radicata]|nr:alpha/beta-hydrolase [Hymenopellis radicata]